MENRYVPLNEDVFLRILLEISDIDDLINACQQNDITFSLCQRMYFWKLWFNKYYPNFYRQPLTIQAYINIARSLKRQEAREALRRIGDVNNLILNQLDPQTRRNVIDAYRF